MVADLGIGPTAWIVLTLVVNLAVYFKFNRLWSLRNVDLMMLFMLTPGMLALVGRPDAQPWIAFVWLCIGTTFWLTRCFIDLGISRRPLLEPNLNAAGLTSLSAGVMALLVAETITLPLAIGAARNPAEPVSSGGEQAASPRNGTRAATLDPPLSLEPGLPRWRSSQIIFARILAVFGHIGIVSAILTVGWRHLGRPIAGLSAASCYLLLPYTRIEVVDSGQVVPAGLIVGAVAVFDRPIVAGLLIGLAGGWMPPCLGLIPLWAGFYWGRGARRFLLAAVGVGAVCGLMGLVSSFGLDDWARALGARSLGEAGLLPGAPAPESGSIWSGIDPVYRLPVLVLYAALLGLIAFWPGQKNLGELIALSAAVLLGSQFWYLQKGGTLVLLYLPLYLLMVFRPNLSHKRPREIVGKRRPPGPGEPESAV